MTGAPAVPHKVHHDIFVEAVPPVGSHAAGLHNSLRVIRIHAAPRLAPSDKTHRDETQARTGSSCEEAGAYCSTGAPIAFAMSVACTLLRLSAGSVVNPT